MRNRQAGGERRKNQQTWQTVANDSSAQSRQRCPAGRQQQRHPVTRKPRRYGAETRSGAAAYRQRNRRNAASERAKPLTKELWRAGVTSMARRGVIQQTIGAYGMRYKARYGEGKRRRTAAGSSTQNPRGSAAGGKRRRRHGEPRSTAEPQRNSKPNQVVAQHRQQAGKRQNQWR